MNETRKWEPMELHHIVCECNSLDHQFVFVVDPDDEFNECYMEIHLTSWKSFWRRAWHAVKYVFGKRQCRYGAWDEVIIKKEDAVRIRDIMVKFLEAREKNVEKIVENSVK